MNKDKSKKPNPNISKMKIWWFICNIIYNKLDYRVI